jgi:hypothetical protein
MVRHRTRSRITSIAAKAVKKGPRVELTRTWSETRGHPSANITEAEPPPNLRRLGE